VECFTISPKLPLSSHEGNPFSLKRPKTPFPKLPPENLPLLRSEIHFFEDPKLPFSPEKGEGNPFFLRPRPHSVKIWAKGYRGTLGQNRVLVFENK
jgi:hypothetical protein